MERTTTLIDLTGQRFGALQVWCRLPNRGRAVYWFCACDCGATAECSSGNLRGGKSRSCGCVRTKHGGWKSKEYASWRHMRQRCDNPEHTAYHNYGGRGIAYCAAWDDFAVFLSDMGAAPAGGTLERIDNNKGYAPDNCRWVTKKEQGRNRRTNKLAPGTAQQIRAMPGDQQVIAKRFGVSQATVSRVKNCKQWNY